MFHSKNNLTHEKRITILKIKIWQKMMMKFKKVKYTELFLDDGP